MLIAPISIEAVYSKQCLTQAAHLPLLKCVSELLDDLGEDLAKK
jgi:hypothetical protein